MTHASIKFARKALLAAACGLALSGGAQAATLAFEHGDTNRFTDVRATDQSQARFEQRILRDLEAHFQKEAAAALPADYSLHVTITDVDLAGSVEYFYPRYPMGLRVVRNVDVPQMDFSYEVRDASGAVVQSGTEELKDLGFRFATLVQRDDDPLRYEKHMVSKWFDRTFES